jgi:hypothetical protein
MGDVMSLRPKGRNVFHNGQHELALSYDGGKTWALTTRRGEIPCDIEWRGRANEDGTATFVSFGWDGTTTVEPDLQNRTEST